MSRRPGSCVLFASFLAACAAALAGCGLGACPPAADLAAVPAASTAVFAARTSSGGVSQVVLLSADGTSISTGPGAGSAVWARTGTPLTVADAPIPELGRVVAFGRAGGIAAPGDTPAPIGAMLLLPGTRASIAHVSVPSGAIDLTTALTEAATDALLIANADGSSVAYVAAPSGLVVYERTAAGAIGAGARVVIEGEATALGRSGRAVLALTTPADDAPAGISRVLMLDAASHAIVQRIDLDASLRGCRTMALVAPRDPGGVGAETSLGVGCRGVTTPTGPMGAGYAFYAVGPSPSEPPRRLGFFSAAAGAPRMVSAMVGIPAFGTATAAFVHAAATADRVTVVLVDGPTRMTRELTSLTIAPPTTGTLGAGAYADDGETRTLLWPGSGRQVLRWTLPDGSTSPVGPQPITVDGCGVLPIVEIVGLGAASAAPDVDGGVGSDAGVRSDAGPGLDAGAGLDAPIGIDAP